MAEVVALPRSPPPPVARHFEEASGGWVPVLQSAVLSGRGRLRISGVTFPARVRSVHATGYDYRRSIECTGFGLPALLADETCLEGHLRQEVPVAVVADERRIEPLSWPYFDAMRRPSSAAVTWHDEGTPALHMAMQDVAYTVDVSSTIGAAGP